MIRGQGGHDIARAARSALSARRPGLFDEFVSRFDKDIVKGRPGCSSPPSCEREERLRRAGQSRLPGGAE